jgi:hypothetical protein
MHSLNELIDRSDSAWPLIQEWVGEAAVRVEILAAETAAGEAALFATQVTTRSPMGAIALHAAGILIDNGWLRVLGAGGHPRFERSLPDWNEGRSKGFYLVADDVLGGSFALNGGALGVDLGKIYYFSPDQLQWEPCRFGYSQFLAWAMSGRLAEFYASLRWDGWAAEVSAVTADQAINVFPPLFVKDAPNNERSHRRVSVSEQYAVQIDLQRQLSRSDFDGST